MRSIMAIILLVSAATPAVAARTFVATLDGLQNVPAIPVVTATGTGVFILNDAETELTIHVEFAGLGSPEVDSHIHNAGFRANGPIVFTLPLGSPKDAVWQLTPDMVTELEAGRLYVNVHSSTYILGEIRGNIAEQQVPVEKKSLGAVKALFATPRGAR